MEGLRNPGENGTSDFVESDEVLQLERLKALVYGQAEILELLSNGASLSTILTAIALWVESQSNNELFASILVMDSTGTRLLHGAAPSLPDDYNQAVNGVLIGPNVGTCGAAAFLKKQVIVEDMARDPNWKQFIPLALKYNLRSSWSTPLINKDGNVVGTFGIYYQDCRKPFEDDIEIIKLVSKTALLAIEHSHAQEERNKLLANEKKNLEKIRQESQHFYRLLMDAPAIIAVLKGPQHVYELTNPLYQQVVGGNRNLIGKPIREALPELEGQGIYELLDEVYSTGEPHIDSELLVKLDRTERGVLENVYFNFVFQPIKNENDQTEGIFIHAVDVSEFVIARQRARESEERFRSFVVNSPMPIGIYVGREMRIETANQAILDTWDRDESVIGKTFREALPELEGQPFYQLLDDVYTSGETYQATAERVDLFRHGRMEITYYNFTYKALRDVHGEIYGVINTGVEVTDLVEARHRLQETQENLRVAMAVAEIGTWQFNLQNQTVYFSDRLREWFGLSSNEGSFDDMMNLVDDADQQRISKALERTQRGEIYDVEFRTWHKVTGQERIIHARGNATFGEKGEIVKINGSAVDITLQKLNEQQLEKEVKHRTLQLEEANKHLQMVNENLNQFAYVASHDLQEPLRKINVFSDLLLKKHADQLQSRGKYYLEKVSGASKRMSGLIKDLLEYSRLDSAEKTFVRINLNAVIRNIITDYELLIKEKNAHIIVGELCSIEAVPLQMNQLFYNLVGNAIKFSQQNSDPVVNISSRMLSKEEILKFPNLVSNWEYAEIVVQDNGIGFNQQYAQQIFVIFQRLHSKNEYEGTGIGLALCKKIVDSHYGEIYAKAEEGCGASFHVILPASRQ